MSYNKSSNLLESRCPDGGTTTNCITYSGPDIPCLGITSGCLLTEVECQVANSICELFKDINLSDPSFTAQIPSCFTQAFATGDYSIQNYILTILNQACSEQILLQNVINGTQPITGIDPIISICYPNCCNPGSCGGSSSQSGCGNQVSVTFSQHILNVLTCLCNLSTLVGTLPNGYATVGCAITTILTSLTQIINNSSAQWANIQAIVLVLQNAGYGGQLITTGYSASSVTPLSPPTGCV